ncbi:epoxide hydrolase family protein [Zobellia sp. B3R18]|uniref:epoxide hydrolase family protein n=1 Tax=Zobellia sp. B3R18 TaxID=2841568 RepID=UPI001C06BB32|nr:epoxide hydrolase family protein [Zobellia sp. B3R18]MBU2973251.1 epoxide hydrolase [Zobellia sp. B3R18]
MIEPYFVNVDQEILDDLNLRIKNSRWPDEINDSDWNYGANLSYMKELSSYWLNDFSWKKIESEINSFPNFMADIDGHQIHFLHIRGKSKKSIPLIITHGWPGSFIEMLKLIPLLTNDEQFSFDLVIPSVIGFGFSSKCVEKGCDNAYVADLWHKLMLELGYNKYGAQGGDIGSGISTRLGMKYPEHIIGIHLNYVSDSFTPYLKEKEISEDVIKYNQGLKEWSAKEAGYAYIQSTKPITLAYGLNDSPIGLCAWIVEKFNSWSDNEGNLENIFTKDEILANITLYWVTQSIHSSVRIYNENSKNPMKFGVNDFVKPPVAYANFPKELSKPPRAYMSKGYNVTQWTNMSKGGHFAAMEKPSLLAEDIIKFYKTIDS